MGRFWKSKIFIITFLSIIISGCATQDANLEKHTIQVTKQQEVSNMQYSSEFSSVRNDFLSSTGLDYEVFDKLLSAKEAAKLLYPKHNAATARRYLTKLRDAKKVSYLKVGTRTF